MKDNDIMTEDEDHDHEHDQRAMEPIYMHRRACDIVVRGGEAAVVFEDDPDIRPAVPAGKQQWRLQTAEAPLERDHLLIRISGFGIIATAMTPQQKMLLEKVVDLHFGAVSTTNTITWEGAAMRVDQMAWRRDILKAVSETTLAISPGGRP